MKRISCPKIGFRYVEDVPLWLILLEDEKNGYINVGIASAENKEEATKIAHASANEKMTVLLVGSLFEYLDVFVKRVQTQDLFEKALGLTREKK